MNQTASPPADPEAAAAQHQRWSRAVVQPLLVTIQVSALIVGLLYVVQGVFQEPWVTLWPLFALLFMETAYSTRWLRRPSQRLIGKGIFRAAEFITFAVMFRLGTWQLFGPNFDQIILRDYLINPLLIFDNIFIGVLVIALIGWLLVQRLITIFEHLSIDAAEYAFFTSPRNEREQNARLISLDRSIIFGDLFRFWASGGIFMTLFIALNTLQLDKITARGNLLRSQAAVPLPLLILTLVYLGTGFLMLSQARLATFSARWLMNGVDAHQSVGHAWHRTGSRRLLIILLLAALLPIGSTFPLLRALMAIFNGIMLGVAAFIGLLQRVLAFFLSLFPAPTQVAEPLPPSLPTLLPLPPIPPPPPSVIPPPDNSIPLLSILVWVALIILAVESTLFFLGTRGLRVPPSLSATITNALKQMWQRWRAEWAFRQALLAELTQLEAPSVPTIKRPSNWSLWRRPLRYDHLPPGTRIRLFFLTLLRLAGDTPLARQPAETPGEYRRRLNDALDEADGDLATLTTLFETARYDTAPLSEPDAQAAETAWQALKKAVKAYAPDSKP